MWFLDCDRSHYAEKMRSHKFNSAYPAEAQWAHDRFWSTVGFCLESAIEVGIGLGRIVASHHRSSSSCQIH
jgi:hypothetical protein